MAYVEVGNVARVAFVDLPVSKLVDAIVVEKGSQNIIGAVSPAASFEGLTTPLFGTSNREANGWYQSNGILSLAVPDASGLHGTEALKIPILDAVTVHMIQTSGAADLPNMPLPPSQSLLSFNMWAKLNAAAPPGINIYMKPGSETDYPTANLLSHKNRIEPGTSWTRLFNGAKNADLEGDAALFWRIVLSVGVGVDFTGAAVFYDVPMLEIDMDRYRTYSTTWLPANLVRPNEIVSTVIDLTVTTAWSLFFEWHPLEARENFLIDIPIISVAGSGSSFLQIMWDHATNKFKVEDAGGSASATLETNWRHLDAIKFILATDGVDTTLHVWDPEQGTKSTAMSGVHMTSAIGSVLHLGTDSLLSEVGCGRYADIRLYRGKLTNSEAIAAFATLDVDPCVGIPLGDFISPMGVDGLDVQLLVDAMTSVSPTQDQICRCDFNGNGIMDVGDSIGMVAALLAGP